MKRKAIISASVLIALTSRAVSLPADAPKLCKTADELHYLTELYSLMNPADSANRTIEFYLENCVRPALKAKAELPWGSKVPEREFIHFVLPLRVNNEAIDSHRPIFYNELRDRTKDMSMSEAILEINHWLHEKATYQPSDGRTHSPLQTVSSAIGRCGEESTFGVAALRSMGIPARQVYTPRWAHTDDNHAWVEAWADGKWYYLGACEPEAVLNHAWFDAPATRAMLMHARVPGNNYDGPEEVLLRLNGNTDINVTSNYAPVDTIRVTITDTNGNPVPDATVSFRIYNYSEFYPMVTKRSDANGNTFAITGLGDLIVWATDGKNFGFTKASVGRDRHANVVLEHDSKSTFTTELNIVPPKGYTPDINVTPELQAINLKRFAYEDSIRNAYVATFPSTDVVKELADRLDIDADELCNIIKLSRGNSKVIVDFLTATPTAQRNKALSLLKSVTEKDLTDITMPVLMSAMTSPEIDTPLYDLYILSPRIEAEELTPFHHYFRSTFSSEQRESFRQSPADWVRYVADNIAADRDWYPAQATMDPMATGLSRNTSTKSRDIYFVAGARTFGIPARIDPVTGKTQYAGSDNNWVDVVFDTNKSESTERHSVNTTLQLVNTENPIVPDPKYFANFSLSKIENGELQLLNYPDFMPLSESFSNPMEIENGQYALVTGQRMADGSVLARMQVLTINDKPVVDSLIVRQDTTQVQVIGSFNSENLFRPIDSETPASILSKTGRGYFVVGIISAGNEPSNHALRDIALEAAEIEKAKLPIVLLFETEEDALKIDPSLLAGLPSTTILGVDINGTIAKEIAENLRLPSAKAPIFIIADTFNRVVFVKQGYTIGLGNQLNHTIKRL